MLLSFINESFINNEFLRIKNSPIHVVGLIFSWCDSPTIITGLIIAFYNINERLNFHFKRIYSVQWSFCKLPYVLQSRFLYSFSSKNVTPISNHDVAHPLYTTNINKCYIMQVIRLLQVCVGREYLEISKTIL